MKKKSAKKSTNKTNPDNPGRIIRTNALVDITASNCVGGMAVAELRASITVEHGDNEHFDGVCGDGLTVWAESSAGILFPLEVTPLTAVPMTGGGWRRTYHAAGEVDCNETYTVHASLDYYIHPAPATDQFSGKVQCTCEDENP